MAPLARSLDLSKISSQNVCRKRKMHLKFGSLYALIVHFVTRVTRAASLWIERKCATCHLETFSYKIYIQYGSFMCFKYICKIIRFENCQQTPRTLKIMHLYAAHRERNATGFDRPLQD